VEHLNTFDAGFLDAEDADHHISLAVGAVAVLDGPIPDFDELVDVIGDRILAIPRLRQVVRRKTMDLSAPVWVDDPDLDLAHHIHRAALPSPGDDAALFGFAAAAMETRLDRDRPLWQCWAIEGLADGRWALLMKVHHCIADGVAAMHMLAGLSDGGEGETYVSAIRAAHAGDRAEPARSGPSLNPLRWARSAWDSAAGLTAAAVSTVSGTLQILEGLLPTTPKSTLNGPVTSMRRYSATRVPLVDAASICQAFDVTLNDVALTAITDSFRATLQRRGEVPRRNSLRTLVPVSVRSADAVNHIGNRISVLLPCLPVDEPDLVAQLQTVHTRLGRAKSSGQRQAGSAAASALSLVPFALATRAIRFVTSLPQRSIVTLATNVAGPQQHLWIMGREVVHLLPVPPVALRLRTAVAVLSYGGDLNFGVTTDFDAFPDIDELTEGIARAMARLAAAARHPHPGRPTLTLVQSSPPDGKREMFSSAGREHDGRLG